MKNSITATALLVLASVGCTENTDPESFSIDPECYPAHQVVYRDVLQANCDANDDDGDLGCMEEVLYPTCLLYTSPSPRDGLLSRMPSSA